jgi:alcohol dehydrogenase
VIAIPTTVGTGSEVTFWSVITDSKRHFKMSVGSTMIARRWRWWIPIWSSACAGGHRIHGMDALTHAIEGYTCKLAEPITDACGIYAIRYIAENIRNAVYTDDKEAKAKMLLGSLIAGICFGNSDIARSSMAEALGGLYDTPHGIANAIMLPYVMEYNYVAVRRICRDSRRDGRMYLGRSEGMRLQGRDGGQKAERGPEYPHAEGNRRQGRGF